MNLLKLANITLNSNHNSQHLTSNRELMLYEFAETGNITRSKNTPAIMNLLKSGNTTRSSHIVNC